MHKVIYVRGDFIKDLLRNYRVLSTNYDELLKKVNKEKLVRKLLTTDFLSYTGAYLSGIEDEYPSYIAVEDWIEGKLKNPSDIDLNDMMVMLDRLSAEITKRLDEEVCEKVSAEEYTSNYMDLIGFDSGIFIIGVTER